VNAPFTLRNAGLSPICMGSQSTFSLPTDSVTAIAPELITALKWDDLEVDDRQLLVQRSVVDGRVDDVKTEYSCDHVPIHGALLEVLLAWVKDCPPTKGGWMFPQPSDTQTLLLNRDPEAASQAYRDQTRIGAARLAYVPPHVPLVAGRDRSSDEGAAGTDATRLHPDDDERLWTGNAGVEERSKWEGRYDGAQTDEGERLKCRFSLLGVSWE